MEETKIWAVDGTAATPLNTTNRMESEGLLEDILTANPDMLEDGLQLIGRQTSTTGGPLDLLGVDTEGRLVVYELKRGTLNREAVAQVIDYASSLNAMDEETLYKHISERSGNLGIQKIDNFDEWYSNNWSDEGREAFMPSRMVLVGLGVDNTTERMVSYMASIGMDISLLTFQGFVESDGKTLLTRNVEVEMTDTAVGTPPKARSRGRARFLEHVQPLDQEMRDLLNSIEGMIRSRLSGYTTSYSNTRMNFNLDYSWQSDWYSRAATVFIETVEVGNRVAIGLHPLAINLITSGEFDKLQDEGFSFETAEAQALVRPAEINYEIKFPIHSLEEWDARKEELTALTQKVCEAYDKARDEALSTQ